MEEFERIVEYSYNPKSECFVIRFLDGSSYTLAIKDLPKKLQTKKPAWECTKLNTQQTGLLIQAGSDLREIPFNIVHSRGKIL